MENGKLEIENAIARLKEYVWKDRLIRKGNINTDYEKFCETYCRDIELIIAAYENTARELLARGK